MQKTLSPVIEIFEDKCVSCHTCIAVCPVKFCMDGSGDVIRIDHERCIGCGRCIEACTHHARGIVDDMGAFLGAAARKEKLVAVAAPAVASVFPEEYLRLNGFLRSLGVSAVFDVSFGAELTIRSYREHLETGSVRTLISQPCPAVVSYIELYRPELLPHLAPYDSPMLHTMKMIRTHFPEYRNHGIVVLSPCLAKKREFDDTGLGDYNVTLLSLKNHLESKALKLSDFEETPYTGPQAERAVLFSTPGGLMRTYLRENPGVLPVTRKIEGHQALYPYLENLPEAIRTGRAPLLVDCLNCEKGCNGGPGTGNSEKHADLLEHPVEKRAAEQTGKFRKKPFANGKKKFRSSVESYWDPDTYRRTYLDRSARGKVPEPAEEVIRDIYRKMLKEKESDFLNCSSCGYGTCRGMAVAIHNGLNKPENCHQYQKRSIELTNIRLSDTTVSLDQQIRGAVAVIGQMKTFVENVSHSCSEQFAAIAESSASVSQMVGSIRKVSDVSAERQVSISELKSIAESGKTDLDKSIRAVQEIAASVSQVGDVVQMIDDIAANTNLLSINASIEAAHAGSTGKGFTVVATEIRRLASSAGNNSRLIAERLDHITRDIRETVGVSEHMGQSIGAIIERINGVAQGFISIVDTLQEISVGSDQIITALHSLNDLSVDVRTSFESMRTSMDSMHRTMEQIAEISNRGTAGIS